jgi:hypothetical protein
MTARDPKERFLVRWSRRKRRSRDEPAPKAPTKADAQPPVPELPPLDQLNHESDFKAFMDKRVDDGLRRMALKKLFSDPRWNETDGLDVYAEDYSALEDLPREMVELQQHARRILQRAEHEPRTQEEPSAAEGQFSGAQALPSGEATADPHRDRAVSAEQRPPRDQDATRGRAQEKGEGRS